MGLLTSPPFGPVILLLQNACNVNHALSCPGRASTDELIQVRIRLGPHSCPRTVYLADMLVITSKHAFVRRDASADIVFTFHIRTLDKQHDCHSITMVRKAALKCERPEYVFG